MKKRFLVLFMSLFLVASGFSIEKTLISYEPFFLNMKITDGENVYKRSVSQLVGFHTAEIWNKASIHVGIVGFFSSESVDLGFNLINNNYVTWSLGIRGMSAGFKYFGLGASTNLDVQIPLNEKFGINVGTGCAFVWWPTGMNFEGVTESDGIILSLDFTPRVGIVLYF